MPLSPIVSVPLPLLPLLQSFPPPTSAASPDTTPNHQTRPSGSVFVPGHTDFCLGHLRASLFARPDSSGRKPRRLGTQRTRGVARDDAAARRRRRPGGTGRSRWLERQQEDPHEGSIWNLKWSPPTRISEAFFDENLSAWIISGVVYSYGSCFRCQVLLAGVAVRLNAPL